ncbi:MAG: TerD family protein [Magnetococcales bacterium]|nr:TerD family protein [Magnetococcales bacterium]
MGVSLQKGQKISLSKESGSTLTQISMGLGWDANTQKKSGILGFFGGGGGEIDLDASCLMFDAAGKLADAIWFQQLRSKDGSIQHTGDNVSGQGEGDDERILVDLSRIPGSVSALVFVVNSFTGQSFESVRNSFCRLVNAVNNQEIARYQLEQTQGKHTALIMVKLYRHEGDWKMHAIGEPSKGKTFHEMLPAITAVL